VPHHEGQETAIKLKAERKAGEMLVGMGKHNGDSRSHVATRADLGISKTQSSRLAAGSDCARGEVPGKR